MLVYGVLGLLLNRLVRPWSASKQAGEALKLFGASDPVYLQSPFPEMSRAPNLSLGGHCSRDWID